MDKPSAILFDFGETLLGDLKFNPLAGNTHLLEKFAEGSGSLRPEDVQEAAALLDKELRSITGPSLIELTTQQFNRLLYDRFNITFRATPETIELEFWKASVCYTPESDISETLYSMKGHGIRMAVISNFPFSGPVLSWELEKQGLLEAFEFVLSSADYGIRKPHPLIFSTALSKLGLPPSEVWFVGDTLQSDIAGAKQAGLWAVWYNRQKKSDEGTLPHAEVGSWSEFTALVRGHLN